MTSPLTQADTLAPASQLMNTEGGRIQVAYLATCALPATSTLVKTDSAGNTYRFPGLLGLAPEWEASACGQNCQEWVSACILSLVNTTGQHVPVWMMAEHPAVGWGQDPAYREQEGSFFGNIFLPTPQAFYCGGRNFDHSIAGRIGSPEADPSYVNIYGSGGLCAGRCTPSDYPYMNDGFKACSGWNHVMTIYHQ